MKKIPTLFERAFDTYIDVYKRQPKNTVIIDMTVMQGVRVTVAAVGRGYPKTAVTTVTAVDVYKRQAPHTRQLPTK